MLTYKAQISPQRKVKPTKLWISIYFHVDNLLRRFPVPYSASGLAAQLAPQKRPLKSGANFIKIRAHFSPALGSNSHSD